MITVRKRKKPDDRGDRTPKRSALSDISSTSNQVYNPCARRLVPTLTSCTPGRTSTPQVATITKNLPSVTPVPTSALHKRQIVFVDDSATENSDDEQGVPSRQLDFQEEPTATTKVPFGATVSIFTVTGVGASCTICCSKVGSGVSAISRHIRQYHPSFVGTVQYAGLSRQIKAAIEIQKHVPVDGDSSLMLKCFSCGRSYLSMQAFSRHQRDQLQCKSSHPVETDAIKLACGRVVNNDTGANATVASVFVANFEPTETFLKTYIRPHEIASLPTYVPLFYPFIQQFEDEGFDLQLLDRIGWWSDPPTAAELPLMDMAERWLMTRARYEVGLVRGHYKAALLQFDCQEIGEVSQNLTYNLQFQA
jgi:hypothetical protein